MSKSAKGAPKAPRGLVQELATPRSSRPPTLSREDWVAAALDVIAAEGVSAVSVEDLARRLAVTKGSFYWHFASREELLRAAFATWEDRATDTLIRGAGEQGKPSERLRFLVEAALDGVHEASVERALLTAGTDALAKEFVARVTRKRVEFLVEVYRSVGLGPAEAHSWALLAYSAYVGLMRIGFDAPELVEKTGTLRAHIENMARTLTVPLATPASLEGRQARGS